MWPLLAFGIAPAHPHIQATTQGHLNFFTSASGFHETCADAGRALHTITEWINKVLAKRRAVVTEPSEEAGAGAGEDEGETHLTVDSALKFRELVHEEVICGALDVFSTLTLVKVESELQDRLKAPSNAKSKSNFASPQDPRRRHLTLLPFPHPPNRKQQGSQRDEPLLCLEVHARL